MLYPRLPGRVSFDVPADPYGAERRCRICDTPLEQDYWMGGEWYCPADHDAAEEPQLTEEEDGE